jgi:hypothetical protein
MHLRALCAHFGEQNLVDFGTCRPLRHFGIVLEQPGDPHLRLTAGSIPTLAMIATFSTRSRCLRPQASEQYLSPLLTNGLLQPRQVPSKPPAREGMSSAR